MEIGSLWWGRDAVGTAVQAHSLAAWIPALFLWSIAEASLLILRLNTPGKWLFGIRVQPRADCPWSFWRLLDRSTNAPLYGQGCNLPVVGWYAGILSYRDLTERGETRWDKGKFAVVAEPFGILKMLLAAGAFLAVYAVGVFQLLS